MAIATLLTAGQKWQEGLSRALRDTDAVLVIVSEASIGIPDLLAESGAALAMFQEQGRPLVIPIIIDRIEVPAPLAHIKAIFEPGRDLARIVAEVLSSIGAIAGRLNAREEQNYLGSCSSF
jgi:hypothetical protein